MDGLIELIFDDVPKVGVNDLIEKLSFDGIITDISHSEFNLPRSHTIGRDFLSLLGSTAPPATLSFNVRSTKIGVVHIEAPLIRILWADAVIEVQVLFERGDIAGAGRPKIVAELAQGARALADEAGAADFYCGLESATDISTRFFSRDKLGPLLKI